MARVKRAVHGRKRHRAYSKGGGLLREPQPLVQVRERGGAALDAVRLQGPQGTQR